MLMVDLILKKRTGQVLTDQEINFIINEYVKSNIPDYQMSAFLMAVCFQGMNEHESTALAMAMRDSGKVYDLSKIKGIKVDKHSTGGVGDKVTLVLGPMVAAVGAKFAKMSGRGLGHTGGTLDKLEAIKGFQLEQSEEDFIELVSKHGLAVIGQSDDVTPADKLLYALRDVTGTVDSVPLMASSIMSKKLASGSDVICLDVKYGSGAFMHTVADAENLANVMVKIGKLAGKKMTAMITSMDEPLGHKIGNGLEVYEAIETLKGNGPEDLVTVVTEIGAYLTVDAKIFKTLEEARKELRKTLTDGRAFGKLREMVVAQKGDVSMIDHPEKFLTAKTHKIYADKAGFIESFKTTDIGTAARLLGAGRLTKEDVLDLDVGVDIHKKIGDKVEKGDLLATIYHNDKGLKQATEVLNSAIKIGKTQKPAELIAKVIR
ncbi:MAG TPA: pyrimidine-nucleoside phosphorylase [Acholeplasmataceae bacterium]|jgi:pyrimidine-nucleoside phosphorylase|nr:pyrimidine-nucleoside phosphorylase [Acholeplasmataceae bacterium]